MAQVQLTDVIVPDEFTAYQIDNSMVSTALSQSVGLSGLSVINPAQAFREWQLAIVRRIKLRSCSVESFQREGSDDFFAG